MQFSTALSLQAADDRFGALHEWIDKHLGDHRPLPVLADQAGMSERNFSRHYAEATGLTTARVIKRLRVEAARRLLSESGLLVKRISQRCGFGSEETMPQLHAAADSNSTRLSGSLQLSTHGFTPASLRAFVAFVKEWQKQKMGD